MLLSAMLSYFFCAEVWGFLVARRWNPPQCLLRFGGFNFENPDQFHDAFRVNHNTAKQKVPSFVPKEYSGTETTEDCVFF